MVLIYLSDYLQISQRLKGAYTLREVIEAMS